MSGFNRLAWTFDDESPLPDIEADLDAIRRLQQPPEQKQSSPHLPQHNNSSGKKPHKDSTPQSSSKHRSKTKNTSSSSSHVQTQQASTSSSPATERTSITDTETATGTQQPDSEAHLKYLVDHLKLKGKASYGLFSLFFL